MANKNLSIMFTDIKGYSERVSKGTREEIASLQKVHDKLLRPIFKQFTGTVIKTIGDAFLVTFESPTDAVQCGLYVQQVLTEHNQTAVENDKLEVRVAINSGEVNVINRDIHGEAVNIAARLEGMAQAGEVYFTEAVYLAMNKEEAPSAEIGEQVFKGIPYPVRVFRALKTDEGGRISASPTRNAGLAYRFTDRQFWLRVGLFGLVMITLLYSVLFWLPKQKLETALQNAEVNDNHRLALEQVVELINYSGSYENELVIAKRLIKKAAIEKGNYLENVRWLNSFVNEHPSLAIVAEQEPMLDAFTELQKLVEQHMSTEQQQAIQTIVNQYPSSPQVAILALQVMNKKLHYSQRLSLIQKALQRGAKPSDEYLDYCFTILTKAPIQSHSTAAFEILQTFYPEQALTWAQDGLKTQHGQHFLSAWHLLELFEQADTGNEYYQQIRQLLKGYRSQQDADAAFSYFKSVTNEAQQKQIMGLHQWLVSKDKGVFSWRYVGLKYVKQNLAKLQAG